MTRENVKWGSKDTARFTYGALLACGAVPGEWVANCPGCDRPMTVSLLAGIGGRPNRYVVQFHTTPFAVCGRFGDDVIRPACNSCNDALPDGVAVDHNDPAWNGHPDSVRLSIREGQAMDYRRADRAVAAAAAGDDAEVSRQAMRARGWF